MPQIHLSSMSVTASDEVPTLDEVRRKIEQRYARAVGAAELHQDTVEGKMLEVDYEDLVEHQEAVSRKMFDFCGLDWDPGCLRFHENARVVRTASNWQVRQPMYSDSLRRWKRYEKHLGPLREALAGAKPTA